MSSAQSQHKKNGPEPKAGKAKEEKPGKPDARASEAKGSQWLLLAFAAVVIAVIAALAFLFVIPAVTGVPFQSFKSEFQSAPRVALAVTYVNQSQLSSEVPCYTTLLEVIGTTRNASTMDFLLINQTKCEYSPTGLGSSASFRVVNASACDEIANNEPSIFMSYGNYNSTRITSDHLYIAADSAYLQKCQIAGEFG